jgi:two-component system sensor histidine kinase HydH
MVERDLGRELEAIRAIARTRKTDELEGLCSEMQLIAAESTQSERAAIYLLDPAARELVMATVPHGYDGDLAQRHRRTSLDGPLMGDAIRTLKPVIFSASSLPELYRAACLAAGFVEFAVVPLHSDGALTGTLNLARTREEPYAPGTVQLALALADQISVQIERGRLYVDEKERARKLARLNDELRKSYEELARAQNELVRRERLASLGELAVLVAHEVRNPLGVMFNVASQLRKLLPPKPREAALLVGILQEEADRLDRIVKDFLDFGRPASPRPKPIDIGAVIDGAIELTRLALRGAQTEQVAWHVDIGPQARHLVADEHLVRQVLVNLFTNAVEAQTSAGAVWVKTSRCEHEGREYLRLSIEDAGATVPSEIFAHAFEPFFTTKASGTGLGLTIVRRTVEAHSGRVSIGPRDAGGTVVTLMLPVGAIDHGDGASRDQGSHAEGSGHR